MIQVHEDHDAGADNPRDAYGQHAGMLLQRADYEAAGPQCLEEGEHADEEAPLGALGQLEGVGRAVHDPLPADDADDEQNETDDSDRPAMLRYLFH